MSLTPGSRIGPYEVTAQIGVGGMGEVYRASDTKLKRQVALKILPASFATDTDRLARFQREAEVLASLNHPNIAAIYGVEESDGLKALVLELVEGLTLADRIAEGPIPLDEALPIAKQIADALEAAHEQGIIHRDVKPANIKLRPDGSVKVLDFGLAKALEPALAQTEVTVAPTMASPGMITGLGTLLGTPAYMSPEQARGKPVDKRSDIWAFGCVLFEILTGRRAFDGDSGPDMLARIIEREPEFSVLPPDTPPSIVRLLRRAMVKDRQMRLPDIAMARIEIADAMTGQDGMLATPILRRHLKWRVVPWVVAALSAASALAMAWAWPRLSVVKNVPLASLELSLPPGVELYEGIAQSFAVSRDGTRVAYVGVKGGARDLYLRPLGKVGADEMVLKSVGNSSLMNSCFFSWDGTAVGFLTTAGVLGKVTLADRRVVILLDRDVERWGATWGPDNRITFARSGTLWQIDASESPARPRQLTTLNAHELSHRWPSVADDGSRVLFTVLTDKPRDSASVWALWVAEGKRDQLEEAASFPLYAASGHLLFFRNGSLLARPFDVARLRLTGPAAPVQDNVGSDLFGTPLVAMSSTGTLMYAPPVRRRVMWVSRKGLEERVSDMPRAYEFPRLAPNGTTIIVGASGDLLVEDTERHDERTLASSETAVNSFPVLTAKGDQVVFRTHVGLRVIDANERNGRSQAIPGTLGSDYPGAISPGGILTFVRISPSTAGDIHFLSLRGGEPPHPFPNTRYYEGGLQFSPPDGRFVTFASDETGQMEVYVAPASDPSARVPVSRPGGGTQPLWARDGRELFYRRGNEMHVVNVSVLGDTVKISGDQRLFERAYSYGSGLTRANYDVDLKNQRFLMVRGEAESGRLNVVLNWLEELKRLAPPTGQ